MKLIIPGITLVAAMMMQAQHAYNSTQLRVHNTADRPAHEITGNVERTTKAIHYGKRTSLTNVAVRGTALLPEVLPDTPLDLYEARNALWIALWAGAEKDAAELFAKAERSLQKAEAFHASGAGARQVLTRETGQTAENDRAIALKRRSENRFRQGRRAWWDDG